MRFNKYFTPVYKSKNGKFPIPRDEMTRKVYQNIPGDKQGTA